MDRTAWIIIGICAALLGLNIYMGNNKKAETAPIPAPQTAAPQPMPRLPASAPEPEPPPRNRPPSTKPLKKTKPPRSLW